MNSRQKLIQQRFLNNEAGVVKRLNQVYQQSLKDITGKVQGFYTEVDQLTKEIEALDPDDPQRAILESMRQSKVYQKDYQMALRGQVSDVLLKMHQKEYLTVSDYLTECYDDGFVGTLYDLQGQGIPFIMPMDQQRVVHAVQLESKISRGLYTRLGQDVDLLKKRITAQISRSLVNGEAFHVCAKRLDQVSGIGKYNAMRIARTEGHRIQNRATMDVMEDAKEKGADVVKQWDATLDGRTRTSHIAVDGEIRELEEPFSNGLMYAGDPNGSAGEVIHCRCATLQRARWALKSGFTKYDGFRDELLDFKKPKDYDEFKKWYFSDENRNYMKFVYDLEQKYMTRNFNTLLSLMTEGEYQKFRELEKASPMWKPKPKKKVARKKTEKKVDLAKIRTEIKNCRSEISDAQRQISDLGRAKRYATASYYQNNLHMIPPEFRNVDLSDVDDKIRALKQHIDDVTKSMRKHGKTLIENLNSTFKVSNPDDDFIDLILNLDGKTTYREVMSRGVKTIDEIVNALAGGDNTEGSCASVGLAYAGQRNGWDVLDFRDGMSRIHFSNSLNLAQISYWDGVKAVHYGDVAGKSSCTLANNFLKTCEVGKEYYLCVGRHASIVRKTEEGTLQYLELQSANRSGWTNFNANPRYTLTHRFGCSSSSGHGERYDFMMNITDSDLNTDKFRTMLGYINTAENEQRKGIHGTIK